ncbi:MAG: MBL fold metallo-hydrolase [Syntrophomonas sp.]
MGKADFQVTFWGVRGSRPVPGPYTLKYGGNTPCVQVQIGKRMLIMDAGTGICGLGQHLLTSSQPVYGDVFITHTHWDHIQGFPFFSPAFKGTNCFILYGQGKLDQTFADLMKRQMMFSYFPVSLDEMGAAINFYELSSGKVIDLKDDILVKTFPNNHPGGGLSYRIDHKGRSCCYITDYEHSYPIDTGLINFVKGTDLLIYDSNFTDQEYAGHDPYSYNVGWGHSTWQEGIKLVKAAEARKLVLFHHANFRTDDDIDRIEQDAQKQYTNLLAAREGMIIEL